MHKVGFISISVGRITGVKGVTNTSSEDISWGPWRILRLLLQKAGLQNMFNPRGILHIPVCPLQRRDGMISADGRLHLREDCSDMSQQNNEWLLVPKLTAHGGIDASDIDQEGQHGKVKRKLGRLVHLVFESFGGLRRTENGIDIQVAETEFALCFGPVGDIWIGEDLLRVIEDGLEQVVLDIRTG